jgi:hypothetical protein
MTVHAVTVGCLNILYESLGGGSASHTTHRTQGLHTKDTTEMQERRCIMGLVLITSESPGDLDPMEPSPFLDHLLINLN